MEKINKFNKKIWNFYTTEGRNNLPWRRTNDGYEILVSEFMLQQTQVERVIPKYKKFLNKFPYLQSLAEVPQSEVIGMWQGLGYNRRALYLKKTAEVLLRKYNGKFPSIENELISLPGIGPATAGSLAAFIHNKPSIFIETNIRRVFIHEFFKDEKEVPDKKVFYLIEEAIDRSNPREWYYALMDYGSSLGKEKENANKQSKHYTKQSKFKGSKREVRGKILKMLLENKKLEVEKIKKDITTSHNILEIIKSLEKEGFIKHSNKEVFLLK